MLKFRPKFGTKFEIIFLNSLSMNNTKQIAVQVLNQVKEQVDVQVWNQIRNQVYAQVRGQVRNQVRENIS